MIISPPFLPARGNDTDEAYLARAMVSPADGAYPVSHNLAWHGGLHLTAPTETTVLPVRAIADGTVAYVRKPTPMPLDPAAADAHALGYNGWTDDGVVVIRHDTEIGADDQGTATAVRFFSIYMHLGSILPAVKADETIYRKTAIGNAGFFEGQASTLHFEIICDDANLEQLIGRSTGEVALGADGRTDAVFGEMYFQLSSALQVHAARPALDQATPTGGTPLGEDLFVGIRYAGGNAEVTTYRADGTTLGAALPEAQAEYHLYRDAGAIVQAYRAAGATAVPAHSAVYELLRFGRVINTAHETLDPADTPHWRQIRTPAGQGWVNLNAAGVFKFSDADAPQWTGWRLAQDYQDGDSRCDLDALRTLLDADNDGFTTGQEAEAHLGDPAVKAFLKRMIAKFPTEWERAAVATRWNWLTNEGPTGGTGFGLSTAPYLTQADFPEFQRYVEALCFWEDANLGIDAAHWHFNPKEFIGHFRKCGWLSARESARLIRKTLREQGSEVAALSWATVTTRLTSSTGKRPADLHPNIQRISRKYGISSTRQRTAHFWGQIAAETGRLEFMVEKGADSYFDKYEPGTDQGTKLGNNQIGDGVRFKGRGLIQLTGRTNYSNYGDYRELTFTTDATSSSLLTIAYNACDGSGYYWASKQRYRLLNKKLVKLGELSINYWADQGADETSQRNVTRSINPAQLHFDFRTQSFQHAYYVLNDETAIYSEYKEIAES